MLRNRSSRGLALAAALATALCGAGLGSASGSRPAVATRSAAVAIVDAAPLSTTTIPGFRIHSSEGVDVPDAEVTKPGFDHEDWFPVTARSTVYAGLLQNHQYGDPFFSTNMAEVDKRQFEEPWWYRSEIDISDTSARTSLDFSGIISRADVWVNGTQVGDDSKIGGAYSRHELDITDQVHEGVNAIAFKIYPNNPHTDLTTGWIDWTQAPPDNNMGMFRDVLVRRGGPVALRGAHVLTRLSDSFSRADLTPKVDLRNDSERAVDAAVTGTVAGVQVSRTVRLAAKEKKSITFADIGISRPKLWWPAGLGGQDLYSMSLTATVGGETSDTTSARFGIREVTSELNSSGARLFRVNGRPLLIRGGGWSPDIALGWDAQHVRDKLSYVRNLGLNTVRLEGHLEPDEFFDMADEMGILVMPGWECCNMWERPVRENEDWDESEHRISKESMKAEAERLRNHPSVLTFLIGSDYGPNERIEKGYLDALRAADWETPVISSASGRGSPQLGDSGMKMFAPYDWVPPNFWYDKAHLREGGAWGFNSETSAGASVPTMDTLRRMMTPAELENMWKNPGAKLYHRSDHSDFDDFRLFGAALTGRYGRPTSLEDFVAKAQLAVYENVRAQFESHSRNYSDATNPSTGLIYWMLNSGWTSLHWQLFDAFLDQNGAYYGAKKANEPLHIQYSYDDRTVVVVNRNHGTATGLSASVKLYNLDGTEKFSQTREVAVPGDGGKAVAMTVPGVAGLSTTYLAKLVLTDPTGREISRNVYWLSTRPDTIDWSKGDEPEYWYYTPTSGYADMSGLSSIAKAQISVTATSTTSGTDTTTTVTLKNSSAGTTPALFLDAHIIDDKNSPTLPVRWNENAVTLWPGESITLQATYRTSDLEGSQPFVRVSGFNTVTQNVPAPR